MATVLNQIGTFVGTKAKESRDLSISQAESATATAVAQVRDGVAAAGDTLKKLYALVAGNRTTWPVANITERDALTSLAVGDHVFVTDDGDTRWGLYLVTGVGPSAFVKVSDPDTLSDQLSASQIKALYESNIDTNVFTDTYETFLSALQTGLASLNTTAKASYVAAINEISAAATAAQNAAADAQDAADALGGRLTTAEAAITAMGGFSDFESAFNAAIA